MSELAEENCKAKVRYRNKPQATHFALKLYAAGMPGVPYKCHVCDRWHLTTRGLRGLR